MAGCFPKWSKSSGIRNRTSADHRATDPPGMNPTTQHDVLVIGGGPAGATAAALLAEHGHSVLVLEREKFPRYHVGESLIPFTFHPLDRLGLIPAMRESAFVRKYSVQFVSTTGKASQPFYFFNRYDRDTVAQTWQVLRSEFDLLLLDNARARGAHVTEETTVTDLLRDGDRVVGARARDRAGVETGHLARITLDCTGKESFAAVRNGWRLRDPQLNKIAVWTYYEGALRELGIDAGATTVAFVPEKGWFWYIPQHNDRVSVGIVAEPKYLTRDGVKDPARMFQREIGRNAWIERHLAPGRQFGPYYVTSEYSFHSRHCGTDGLLLVGDAFCFLDPVFSSGLMLALKSGVLAADAIHAGLVEGDLGADRFQGYADTLRQGIENMRKLVYAFYDPNFSFRALTDKYADLAGDVTDCLSGDVNKDFSRLWAAIREFAEIPDDLPYGQPLVAARPAAA
jgi:flavin-dependent dehydrogenase